MRERVIRMRIPEDLYKRFLHICVDRQLTAPKQMTELLRKFVEVTEQNIKLSRSA